VDVPVTEGRDGESAAQVDHAGEGPDEFANVVVAADRGDRAALDRCGLREP
jgi:hypothetical protein